MTLTERIPAWKLCQGDVVAGSPGRAHRLVAEVVPDEWGRWVTYVDGGHDVFPPGSKVTVVL